MKIVFMGTPDFSAVSLQRLYGDGHDIAGVFTQPDKPRDRGMKVSASPVKELALEHGTRVFQPVSLKNAEAADVLRGLSCELVTVVAYGKLLPREILDIPEYGCVNIHGSLLPEYRGAAPIQRAILNGEKETGLTSIFMAEEMDAGDILYAVETPIYDDETAGALAARMSILGAGLLSETVAAISSGKAVRRPQDHSRATFAPPLGKELSPINWSETALAIKAKVRGLNPWPVATAVLNGVTFKVFTVEINSDVSGKAPGEIVEAGNEGLKIACCDGSVIIKELQPPGGRRMSAADYIRGHL